MKAKNIFILFVVFAIVFSLAACAPTPKVSNFYMAKDEQGANKTGQKLDLEGSLNLCIGNNVKLSHADNSILSEFKKDHLLKSLRVNDALEVMKRIWLMPTFEVHGIAGGYQGPGVKTIVPPTATAIVSCRLVPNMEPKAEESCSTVARQKSFPKLFTEKYKNAAALCPHIQIPVIE